MTLKQLAKHATPYDLAIQDDRPVFLEFYANWCTTCQSMAPSVDALHQKYGNEVDFVLLDIDDPQWQQPLDQFGVTGVPQITLLKADQTIVGNWVGAVPSSILDNALAQFSS